MPSRRPLIALLAAAVVGMVLTGAPATAHADRARVRRESGRPRRHAHRHRDGRRDGRGDQQLPRRLRAVRNGAVLAGHHRQLRRLRLRQPALHRVQHDPRLGGLRRVRRHLDAADHHRNRLAALERLGKDRPRRHRGGRARLLHRAVPRHRSDRGTHRHHPHRRRPVQLPAQRSARPVPRALRRVAGGQLPRDHPDRRGQHHDHRMGDQRRILRQEQHLHGVFRDEVQPAVHLLRHLGRLLGLSRRPQRGFAVQRGVRGVPGRLGARGADRDLLRRCRRSAGKPGGRGRSELRRRPRRRIGRMERRAVAYRGGRQRWRRRGDLLHLPVPIAVAPQHLQRRRRTLHRIRRRHPHRGRRGTPSTPTSPTGTPTGAWQPCRRCFSRSEPATWPNRW